jgi:hypothetical protein
MAMTLIKSSRQKEIFYTWYECFYRVQMLLTTVDATVLVKIFSWINQLIRLFHHNERAVFFWLS